MTPPNHLQPPLPALSPMTLGSPGLTQADHGSLEADNDIACSNQAGPEKQFWVMPLPLLAFQINLFNAA